MANIEGVSEGKKRLVEIIGIIKESPGMKAKTEKTKVSVQTTERDIKLLKKFLIMEFRGAKKNRWLLFDRRV